MHAHLTTEQPSKTKRTHRENPLPLDQRASHSVNEYCALHGIGRTSLYAMWKNGTGPEFFLVGSRRRIPRGALPKSPEVAR
jgi:hypothetical protein